MPPLSPLVVTLTPFGSAQASDASGRNASHVRYVGTHGALEANAAHVLYQATHDPLAGAQGQHLIGNAASGGLQDAIAEAQATQSHQWRWVVSLRGDEADRLGYDTNRWHELAREIAPRLAAACGIKPEHVRWVAAHHDPAPAMGQDRKRQRDDGRGRDH